MDDRLKLLTTQENDTSTFRKPKEQMKALDELKEIMRIRDDKAFHSSKTREAELKEWIYRWIVEVDSSQLVMDSKYLTSEYEDTLKERLALNMLEKVTEECVAYSEAKNKISSEMLVFRRKPRK